MFDVDSEEIANDLIGTVVEVEVTNSAPLLLLGALVHNLVER